MRKRERELTALKGALKEEVSSHDLEMDKLKEQYDAELQALRESVEEATKVGGGQSAGVPRRAGPPLPPGPLFAFLSETDHGSRPCSRRINSAVLLLTILSL